MPEQVGMECQLGEFPGLQTACALRFLHAPLLLLLSAPLSAPERMVARAQADTGGLGDQPQLGQGALAED